MLSTVMIMLIVIAVVAVVALILSIVSVTSNNGGEKKVLVNDKDFSAKNGVLYARGFSNEPFKTTQQATIVGERTIAAETVTDGSTIMTGGNVTVKDTMTAKRVTDGNMVMENGDLTTSGCLTADRIIVNRGLSVPAEYFAHIFILSMNPVDFQEHNEWKPIGSTTKKIQLFFPGDDRLDHGVSLHNGNKFQLHKEGRWQYSFIWIVRTDDNDAVIGAALSQHEPKLASGYGISNGVGKQSIVSGTGVLNVNDIDDLFQFWITHTQQVVEHEVQVIDGHATITYLGR